MTSWAQPRSAFARIWLNRTGVACPDAKLAHELKSFEPVARAVEVVLKRAAVSAESRAALTVDLAERFARLALANVAREYPTKLDHVINGPDDVRLPSELHPLFQGSFDWHSCVHAHWMLARLLRLFPDAPFAGAVRNWFSQRLTESNVAGEIAYLAQPNRGSFVRTYGWAWLLKLAEELELGKPGPAPTSRASRSGAIRCRRSRRASSGCISTTFPQARVPLRYGLHPNSAFGLALALDYATTTGQQPLRALCIEKALDWFAADTDYPGALRAVGQRIPVAGADRSGPDAPRARPARVPDVAQSLPAGTRARASPDIVHAGRRRRSLRSADGASRRLESQPRLVPLRNRRGARPG
jgi:hypothetical protein